MSTAALNPAFSTVAAALAPPPSLTFSQRVSNNAEVMLKSGSTYVVVVAGILAALYASLTTAQQTQLVEALPFLKGWSPAVTVVIAFIATKLKPSNTVSTQTQAMLSELAALRLNAFLRAHGSVELPVPAAPLPVTPTVVPVPVAIPVVPVPVSVPVPVAVVAASPADALSTSEKETALLGLVGDYIAEQRAKMSPQVDAGTHQ